MNTKAITATTESIAHYGRMIRWAEKQDVDDMPCERHMKSEIDEHWHAQYCHLCAEFYDTADVCGICPIYRHDGVSNCVGEIDYSRMHDADTWRTWLIEARRIRAYLGMLRGKLKRGEL